MEMEKWSYIKRIYAARSTGSVTGIVFLPFQMKTDSVWHNYTLRNAEILKLNYNLN